MFVMMSQFVFIYLYTFISTRHVQKTKTHNLDTYVLTDASLVKLS